MSGYRLFFAYAREDDMPRTLRPNGTHVPGVGWAPHDIERYTLEES